MSRECRSNRNPVFENGQAIDSCIALMPLVTPQRSKRGMSGGIVWHYTDARRPQQPVPRLTDALHRRLCYHRPTLASLWVNSMEPICLPVRHKRYTEWRGIGEADEAMLEVPRLNEVRPRVSWNGVPDVRHCPLF